MFGGVAGQSHGRQLVGGLYPDYHRHAAGSGFQDERSGMQPLFLGERVKLADELRPNDAVGARADHEIHLLDDAGLVDTVAHVERRLQNRITASKFRRARGGASGLG